MDVRRTADRPTSQPVYCGLITLQRRVRSCHTARRTSAATAMARGTVATDGTYGPVNSIALYW
ncbi:hypothetical protein ABZZ79_20015 [Streptomyces sp. NPDC006458]|uniref:hypothetical protein n=1 Tax=Streptomyces sp. NPDC006458 TaxID=3154302 RepID=UPI0033AA0409